MSVQIFHNLDFNVYKAGNGYIVHNKNKDFKRGHTHVQKYDTCMVMIKLIEKKQLPKSRSKYFLESLIRLSNDSKYTKRIKEYIIVS